MISSAFTRSRPLLARHDVSPHLVKWWKGVRPDDGQVRQKMSFDFIFCATSVGLVERVQVLISALRSLYDIVVLGSLDCHQLSRCALCSLKAYNTWNSHFYVVCYSPSHKKANASFAMLHIPANHRVYKHLLILLVSDELLISFTDHTPFVTLRATNYYALDQDMAQKSKSCLHFNAVVNVHVIFS